MNLNSDALQNYYDNEYFEDRNTVALKEARAYWKNIPEAQHQKDHEEMLISLAESEKKDPVNSTISGDARNHYDDYIDSLENYNTVDFSKAWACWEAIPASQHQSDEEQETRRLSLN